jgi:hypothetical protein
MLHNYYCGKYARNSLYTTKKSINSDLNEVSSPKFIKSDTRNSRFARRTISSVYPQEKYAKALLTDKFLNHLTQARKVAHKTAKCIPRVTIGEDLRAAPSKILYNISYLYKGLPFQNRVHVVKHNCLYLYITQNRPSHTLAQTRRRNQIRRCYFTMQGNNSMVEPTIKVRPYLKSKRVSAN